MNGMWCGPPCLDRIGAAVVESAPRAPSAPVDRSRRRRLYGDSRCTGRLIERGQCTADEGWPLNLRRPADCCVMASRLDDSRGSPSTSSRRVLRAHRRAERRELLTECSRPWLSSSRRGLWAASSLSRTAPWAAGCGCGSRCARVLVRIEFEVGEGTRGRCMLAFVPMLLLLPAPAGPARRAAAHLPAPVAEGRCAAARPRSGCCCSVARLAGSPSPGRRDRWPSCGVPSELRRAAALMVAALAALDRLRPGDLVRCGCASGSGMDPRAELRGFAWVYLVDAAWRPVGLLAALAGRAHPALLVARAAARGPARDLRARAARPDRQRAGAAAASRRRAATGCSRSCSNSSDCILIVGADGTIKTLTGSVAADLRRGLGRAQGSPLLERVHPHDAAPVRAFLAAVAAKPAGRAARGRVADALRRRHLPARLRGGHQPARRRRASRASSLTARDVEARKAFEEQLRHRAFHDALTGLANRALFYDRIEHALSARRAFDVRRSRVLFVDLDDFKADQRHARACRRRPRCCSEVARRLTPALRSADTAARLGGDEFGVLLEELAGPRGAAAPAARVLEALAPADRARRRAGRRLGQRRHGDQRRRRTAASRSSCARPTSRCTRPSAAASGRAELYEPRASSAATRHAGPRGQWFARDDEQRAEIEAVLADPDGIDDRLPADHGPAHRPGRRLRVARRASTASRAAAAGRSGSRRPTAAGSATRSRPRRIAAALGDARPARAAPT